MWRQFTRNTAGSLVTTLLTSLTGFVLSIMLSRALGPERYGNYAYAIFLVSTGSTLLAFGIPQALNRFVAEAIGRRDQRAAAHLILVGLSFLTGTSGAVALAIVIFREPVARLVGTGNAPAALLAVVAITVPTIVVAAFRSTFSALLRMDLFAWMMGVGLLLRLVAYGVMLHLGAGLLPLLLTEAASSTITAGLLAIPLLRRLRAARNSGNPADHLVWRTRFFRYSGAMTAIALLDFVVWWRFEVVFIKALLNANDVAYYSVATAIPTIAMSLLPAAISASVTPLVAREYGAGHHDAIRSLFTNVERLTAAIVFPLAVGGCLLSPQIIAVIYGESYHPAVAPMRIAFLASTAVALLGVASAVLYGIGAPSFAIKLGIALAPVSIGLNIFLISRIGLVGAALANGLVQAAAAPYTIHQLTRRIGQRWPWSADLRTLGATGIMAGSVLFVQSLRLPPAVTLLLGVATGVLVFLAAAIRVGTVRRHELVMMYALAARHPIGRRVLAPLSNGTLGKPATVVAAAGLVAILGTATGLGFGIYVLALMIAMIGVLVITSSPVAATAAMLALVNCDPMYQSDPSKRFLMHGAMGKLLLLVWIGILIGTPALTLLSALWRQPSNKRDQPVTLIGASAIALLAMLSFPRIESASISIRWLIPIWVPALAIWMLAQNIDSPRAMRVVIVAVAGSAALNGLLGFSQLNTLQWETGVRRLAGVTGDPNFLALQLGAALLLLPAVISTWRAWTTLIVAPLAGVLLWLIVLTVSRGALVGLAVAGMASLILLRGVKLRLLLMTSMAATGFIVLSNSTFQRRAVEIQQTGEGNGRTGVWSDAFTIWSHHPFIGVGYKNYVGAAADFFNRPVNATHNLLLQCLTDFGIFGLLAFLLPIGYLIFRLSRGVMSMRRSPHSADMTWYLLAVIFSLTAAFFLDTLYFAPLWVVLGLAERRLTLGLAQPVTEPVAIRSTFPAARAAVVTRGAG